MKAKIFVGDVKTSKSRVANLIAEYIGSEQTMMINAKNKKEISQTVLNGISENVKLLIIDDCHPNFRFEQFFPVKDERPGELSFEITQNRKGERLSFVYIPFIIFIMNAINYPGIKSASFMARFDVLEFPLSNSNK